MPGGSSTPGPYTIRHLPGIAWPAYPWALSLPGYTTLSAGRVLYVTAVYAVRRRCLSGALGSKALSALGREASQWKLRFLESGAPIRQDYEELTR